MVHTEAEEEALGGETMTGRPGAEPSSSFPWPPTSSGWHSGPGLYLETGFEVQFLHVGSYLTMLQGKAAARGTAQRSV